MQIPFSYSDTGSPLHRLNAFVLLLWGLVVVLAALLLSHPVTLAVVFGATFLVAVAARVGRRWSRVMRYVVWMGLTIVAINAVVSGQGSHVLLEAGFSLPLLGTPRLTAEALAFGAAMAVRLAVIISTFTLLNLCVHPDDAMRAAIRLRMPYRSVLVTSLATRFVPVLLADAAVIADVQRSRGLDFQRGSLAQRVRSGGALILPLLSNSLDRATQVAEALEARGYGAGTRRTFFREPSFRIEDVVALLLLVVAVALVLFMRARGIDSYTYYPALGDLAMSVPARAALVALFALLVPVPLAVLRRRRSGD